MTTSLQRREFRPQTLRILLALLCVVLVVFIGSAQLLHMHAGTENSDPGCSLCAVAHLAALPTPALVSPVAADLVQPVAASDPGLAPPRFPSYSYDSRPPPVSAR